MIIENQERWEEMEVEQEFEACRAMHREEEKDRLPTGCENGETVTEVPYNAEQWEQFEADCAYAEGLDNPTYFDKIPSHSEMRPALPNIPKSAIRSEILAVLPTPRTPDIRATSFQGLIVPEEQKSFSAAGLAQHPHIQMAATMPVTQSNGLVNTQALAPDAILSQRKSRGVTAYDAAQQLIADGNIVVYGNAPYFFDGRIYRMLRKEDMKRLIVDRCRTEVREAGNAHFVEGIYQVLLAEPKIYITNPYTAQEQLVFLDSVLNLETGQCGPHSPQTFATSYLVANYSNGTQGACPLFDSFIKGISDGDEELECRIWQVLGYYLTEDMNGKCFVVFQGPPDSGKSILGNFLRTCYNPEAVTSLDPHSFDKNFAISSMIGKRLCIDLDLPAGAINSHAISYLKKMTGKDMLTADIKYMNRVEFMNTAKLLFASNHAVISGVRDEAFLRRMVAVPFYRSIPREHQDVHLSEKLAAERDAVIVKALGYYKMLKAQNYQFAGEASANKHAFRGEDIYSELLRFLKEHCDEDENAWTSTQSLHRAFCFFSGIDCAVNSFSRKLNQVLPTGFPSASAKRDRQISASNPLGGYQGLRLKQEVLASLPGGGI